MNTRENTKVVKVGNKTIGGNNTVLIQSMCNIKTSNYVAVAKQINECANYGADLMRVSILDMEDAKAIKEIKKRINIPLVADIHFDYKLAIECIKNGVDKIRINPGNIGSIEGIKELVEYCKNYNVPIRIGVNSGSVDKELSKTGVHNAELLVESAKKHVKILEDLAFTNIIISIKSSNVRETIEAYSLASQIFPYPLHLGVTEAGTSDYSLIRSAAALSPLLLNGIGNTIRISITGNPVDEIIAAKRLLHDVDLYASYPTLISCPTCGRTCVNLEDLAKRISIYLETIKKPVKVAIMGCIVNGPGEAKNADIGLAGGKECFALFKKGIVVKTIPEKDAYTELINEINNF
ncbi:MAG: flavodoxin-dependent (E)-4-hydroxy-3-methylbut-2-enyl-diphosphate synthase [Bacilli bacterium]